MGGKLLNPDLKNLGLTAWKRRHKLQDKWEDEEYQLVGKHTPGIHVFKVQMVDGRKTRMLHRNLLLPLQGRLRQHGDMERDATSESDIEENGNTEVSGVPILPHVGPMRGTPLLNHKPIS